MSVLVIVIYGGADPYRERSRELVLQHYGLELPEWDGHLATWPGPLSPADNEAGPFPKAWLVNNTVRNVHRLRKRLDDQTVLVLNDADSLVPPEQIQEAVRLAGDGAGLVFAFTEYVRLDKATSSAIKSWDDCAAAAAGSRDATFTDSGSHGCVAIRRDAFLELGGLDERYQFSYEDLDFNNRAAERWPLRRVDGPLYHLWHPRDPEQESLNLERYRAQWGWPT